ncbi:MAG TPA: hypothetical protein ENH82_19760 [bacterium]|nr:hypothetical protein [bacterium]
MTTRLEQKEKFILAVSKYLVENQAGKSIVLQNESETQLPHPWAREWSKVRAASPIFGYATEEEVAQALRELL